MNSLSSHSSYLLQQLQEQRIQGLLCDCMLVVKGICFKAHKNVLAAFSSYFRSLFQNSPGQKNDVFNLVIQDVGGIGQILDYMYTSHLDVNQDNVQALLVIAQCLQVPNVLSMCQSFLKTCGPTAEASSFPLPAVLTSDLECTPAMGTIPDVSGSHSPSTEVLRPTSSDPDPSRRLSSALPTSHSFEPPRSTAVSQEKQLSHGYKLRNFYSRQYFKQSAALSESPSAHQRPLVVVEEPFPQRIADPVVHQENTTPPAPAPLTPADGSAGFIPPADTEPPVAPGSGVEDSPIHRQVRPKKAVYLKKYNYLRSQRALEELGLDTGEPLDSRPQETTAGEPLRRAEETPVENPMAERQAEPELPSISQLPSPPPVDPVEPHQRVANDQAQPAQQRQYWCEMCGKTFKHPSNLELHKRSHTGEKPFQCNICGKNFSQAGNLQTHLRRHSGEKPYICEICGKSFAASGDVQRHIVIHTGERPHLCDICGRGFSNFSNLKEHKKTHTADKVFTCDQCGKSFNMQRKLLKHRVRHSGERPYSCQTCGKSFAGSGDLRRHVRTHTGERPYTCDTCGKCFTRSAVLRRHRSTHCPTGEDAGQPGAQGSPFEQPETQQDPESLTALLTPVLDKPLSAQNNTPPGVHLGPSAVPHHLLSTQPEKCAPPDSLKLHKAHLHHETFTYAEGEDGLVGEEPLHGASSSMVRPSLSTLDNHCSLPLGSRTNSAPYRSNEAPFFSSVTLWGLAMKTLQNDNEMEQ